jgi:hypothetical protein
VEDHAVVTYRFQQLAENAARPVRLVLSVDTPDDDLPPATYAFTVHAPSGVVAHPAKLEAGRRAVVRAVAYSDQGVQSELVSAEVPAR